MMFQRNPAKTWHANKAIRREGDRKREVVRKGTREGNELGEKERVQRRY